jgi:hypothetical protein
MRMEDLLGKRILEIYEEWVTEPDLTCMSDNIGSIRKYNNDEDAFTLMMYFYDLYVAIEFTMEESLYAEGFIEPPNYSEIKVTPPGEENLLDDNPLLKDYIRAHAPTFDE